MGIFTIIDFRQNKLDDHPLNDDPYKVLATPLAPLNSL